MTGKSRRRRGWMLWLAVAGAVVIAAVSILQLRGEGGQSSSLGGDDPGVVHVHGLGIDPRDGTLYAATHLGLFRIPERGEAERIADRYQDTMGFTVAGPDRFLASGHPDLRDQELRVDGKPPLLGLIESTDRGESWQPLSLLGDADFHSLAFVGGQIYGYDSTGQRFMTSIDALEWSARSSVQLLSFAVDPKSPDVIVGGTGEGVLRSVDGGRTWTPVDGAPSVAFVAWDATTGLWAATADARLAHSADGSTWDDRGALPGGSAEAILADGVMLYVATHTGIHRSSDGGQHWELRYENPPRG